MSNLSYTEYIDSDYAKSGTVSDFTYDIVPPRKFNRFSLVSCSIPKTFYMIQDTYNTFIVEENGVQRTITIPPGNYSNITFPAVMTPLLNANPPYVYTFSAFDNATCKFTITVSGNAGIQPKFIFPNTSVLYRNFGFNFGSTNSFSGNSITGTNIALFQHTNVIFVRSDLYAGDSSSLSGNIICQASCINSPFMSSIVYQVSDPRLQGKEFNPARTTFRFWITDSDGFILDLNGIPLNIEIVFYNEDNTNKLTMGKAILDNLDSQVEKLFKRYNIDTNVNPK